MLIYDVPFEPSDLGWYWPDETQSRDSALWYCVEADTWDDHDMVVQPTPQEYYEIVLRVVDYYIKHAAHLDPVWGYVKLAYALSFDSFADIAARYAKLPFYGGFSEVGVHAALMRLLEEGFFREAENLSLLNWPDTMSLVTVQDTRLSEAIFNDKGVGY